MFSNEKSLKKCVLAMSDLQLATVIAILISGYSQLHCGLSCYHWNIVGQLAWFSSLTHLSCLTLLRNHLYNHPAERQWRLLFMFILIVMLITSMAPTGNYDWDHNEIVNRPSQPDYAICYYSKPPARSSAAYLSMIALVLLFVWSNFINRRRFLSLEGEDGV